MSFCEKFIVFHVLNFDKYIFYFYKMFDFLFSRLEGYKH